LTGDFQPGDHIEADVAGDQIAFHRQVKGAAA
jgi:hypothetical protein